MDHIPETSLADLRAAHARLAVRLAELTARLDQIEATFNTILLRLANIEIERELLE